MTKSICTAVCLLLSLANSLLGQAPAEFTRTQDVLYGRKYGTALTLDVFCPARQNGAAVIQVISGGFFSSHDAIQEGIAKPFLERGYTVFAVVHGSQPKFQIPEICQDIHRAIRFIRSKSSDYGIDPLRFGIMGASAGGHLSLTLGTQGGPGDPNSKDLIERQTSAVQAVACFFPPTDFLNYGSPGEDAVGVGVLAAFKPAFGPRSDTPEGRQALGKEISPFNFITGSLPPTLILHGDADKLVPIQQARVFVDKAKSLGANAKLIVREGQGHGWPTLGEDLNLLVAWFDEHLAKK